MNRRERQHQKKKHDREERLRRARHAQHYGTGPARESPDDLEDEENLSPEDMVESEAGVSPFLFESSIRGARLASLVDALPDGPEKESIVEEMNAGVEWPEVGELIHEALPGETPEDLKRRNAELRLHLTRSEVKLICLLFPVDPETEEERANRIELLVQLVARAETRLADREPGPEMLPAREDPDMRSSLRTRLALAECYFRAGRVDPALDQLAAVRELDPQDHLGAGHRLLGHFLEQADLPRARAILETMAGDEHAVPLWGLVLERHLSGDLPGAARARMRAARANPLVEGILVPRKEVHLDCAPEHAQHLHAEMASLIVNLGRAWKKNAPATKWLFEGGLSTTPEQRAAAVATYAPPVAGLLSLGTAESEGPWPDYLSRFGLGSEHEPKLVRLVSDPAIRESRWPEVWAPIHAWRALAQLRATSAATPLCALVREHFDDEWVADEMSRVFETIGAPALPALRVLLADREADADACGIAAVAMGRIARAHPECRAEVVSSLLGELHPDRMGGRELNGWIVGELVDLGVVEAEALIAELYDSGNIDEFIAGERDEALERLREHAQP